MMRRIGNLSLLGLVLCVGGAAPGQTIGLQLVDPAFTDGYVLFTPIPSTSTWLIDKCGRVVHEWPGTYQPGQSVYLLDDGTLMRTGNTQNASFNSGGRGGVVQRLDWTGQVLWSYTISDTQQCQHHDIRPMPDGHVLVIAWERRSMAEALAAGRDPALLGNSLWSEKVVELEPIGADGANIVWEWHLWDHLVQDYDAGLPNHGVPAEHPELVDLNFAPGNGAPDWIHLNSIDYNADLDQIALSTHNLNEVWVIDHGTTSAEAAGHAGGTQGHGGDLLYRWGNPQVYDRGLPADQRFFGQHNVRWVPDGFAGAGDLLLFNNGIGRPGGPYSTIDRITPPVNGDGSYSINGMEAFGPIGASFEWSASTPTDFYAMNISGVQPMDNGGYMVCSGPQGIFFELDGAGNEVWRYINPVNMGGPMTQGQVPMGNSVFRCTHIAPEHPGLAGADLTPGAPIELDPLPDPCTTLDVASHPMEMDWTAMPVPADASVRITGGGLDGAVVMLFDRLGRPVIRSRVPRLDGSMVDLSALPEGVYSLVVQSAALRSARTIVVVH